jgi:N-acetylneuraminate synthase
MAKTSIIAEIGLNYAYGDNKYNFIPQAKRLIDIAALAGCTHVKFQKRYPDVCVPEAEKEKPKTVPWEKEQITYLQYKKDIEFSFAEMVHLFAYAKEKGVIPFASAWDQVSAGQLSAITDIVKIPSALLTNIKLLSFCQERFTTRMLSTGMSTQEKIDKAIEVFQPEILFHTNSTYPTPIDDVNLGYINYLKKKYPDKKIGFSNHYYGIVPAMASVALGVDWIEVHITENHELWGSDQKASIESNGVFKLVKGIRDLEKALEGGDCPRVPYPGEEEKRITLRGD